MSLSWLPRDDHLKDHGLMKGEYWGTEAPCTVYEKRPLTDPQGKEVQEAFRAICKEKGVPHNWGWKIFEVSGSKPGQETALQLLSFVGKLVVVGYTMATTEYMLSKLMAFDAEMIGTWGCLPKYYPEVLKLVQAGKVQVEPFIETRPMSAIRETFAAIHDRKVEKRVILEPDF